MNLIILNILPLCFIRKKDPNQQIIKVPGFTFLSFFRKIILGVYRQSCDKVKSKYCLRICRTWTRVSGRHWPMFTYVRWRAEPGHPCPYDTVVSVGQTPSHVMHFSWKNKFMVNFTSEKLASKYLHRAWIQKKILIVYASLCVIIEQKTCHWIK